MTSEKSQILSIRLRSSALAAAGLVAIGSMAACSPENVAEQIIEAGADGDVDVDIDNDGGEITIDSDDGSVTISSGGDLPDNWPDQVPVIDGKITGSSAITVDEGTSYSVVIEVSGSVSDIFDRLKSDMEAANFEKDSESTFSTGDGTFSTATFTSAEHQVIISVSDTSETTTVSYAVTTAGN